MECGIGNLDQLLEAANNGDVKAMNELANTYANGNGVEKHLSNAVMWWKKSASGGCAEAALQLVNYYKDKDRKEAAKYYSIAADNSDNPILYYEAGMMNWSCRNLEKAEMYLLKAADAGLDVKIALDAVAAERDNKENKDYQEQRKEEDGNIVWGLLILIIIAALYCFSHIIGN